jgi:hypothetical protein
VDEHSYKEYVQNLLPVDIDSANSFDELVDENCATGACPIK